MNTKWLTVLALGVAPVAFFGTACTQEAPAPDDDELLGHGAGRGAGGAVDVGAGTGGRGSGGATSGPSGGSAGAMGAGGSESSGVYWPNEESSANSDDWLIEHHDEIDQLRPKVVVLNYHNPTSPEQAQDLVERYVEMMRQASTYHGYDDEGQQPFLDYQVLKIVNLRDDPIPSDTGFVNASTQLVPLEEWYGQEYADNVFQFADPGDPSRNLTLCEMFEQGVVNEIWQIAGETGTWNNGDDWYRPYEGKASRFRYDEDLARLPGEPDHCGGNGCFGERHLPEVLCGVTVRIMPINPERGLGCSLEGFGHNFERLPQDIAYIDKAGTWSRFMGFDLKKHYPDLPFGSFYELCAGGECIGYPAPDVVEATFEGNTYTLLDWNPGCGNAHLAPNARHQYDVQSEFDANSRCEHFGLADGPDGEDLVEVFNHERIAANFSVADDCTGPWDLYWLQSVPGKGSGAQEDDGRPLKNWWPFWYY